jgi:hypothetical protein
VVDKIVKGKINTSRSHNFTAGMQKLEDSIFLTESPNASREHLTNRKSNTVFLAKDSFYQTQNSVT